MDDGVNEVLARLDGQKLDGLGALQERRPSRLTVGRHHRVATSGGHEPDKGEAKEAESHQVWNAPIYQPAPRRGK